MSPRTSQKTSRTSSETSANVCVVTVETLRTSSATDVLVRCVLWRVLCLRGCSFNRHGWLFRHLVRQQLYPCLHDVSYVKLDVFMDVRRDTDSDFCRRVLDVSDEDIQLCWVRRQTVMVDVVADVFNSDVWTWPCHCGRRLCLLPCRNGRLGKHALLHGGYLQRCKLGPRGVHWRKF